VTDSDFWSARVRRHGHTGWADPVTYQFDQRLRLRTVGDTILGLGLPAAARCLDFGCGVGDFSAMLANAGHKVWAYDISEPVLRRAAALNPSPRITYTGDLAATMANPLDLILSVTVLQHVIDDDELQRLLSTFRNALATNGRLVVLETFATEDRIDEYQHRRTIASFLKAASSAAFFLERDRPFYHPTERSTASFRAYRRNPVVRLLSRAGRLPGVARILGYVAGRYVGVTEDSPVTGSPTHLMVFGAGESSNG
jgi:2-polyprenyl-3-methyl-5-hydroxy-6-metoxy-1,4-benzoquinol methylase